MTASLYQQNGRYHVMLSWQHEGERNRKSVATGIFVKGNNKREAKAAMEGILNEWRGKVTENFSDILFSDYLSQWLENQRKTKEIKDTTYYSYKLTIERKIAPYFAERKIKLNDIKAYHIKDFYAWAMETYGVSVNTIHHYHANIQKALRIALEDERIPKDPAAKMSLPKAEKFRGTFYSTEELRVLIDVVAGTKLEVPVMLASWFGMRRGEVIGCRWNAIDFDAKTLFMCGTVTSWGDGTPTECLTYNSFAKTPESIRTYPLTDEMVSYFKALREKQLENRRLAGREYNQQWLDFVCVDEMGNLTLPNYITHMFPKVIKKHGLKKVRFHDLRHTNASLLLEHGASIKEIQDWLGHKSMYTTADIYAHVQTKAKEKLAESISNLLSKV